MSDLAGFDLNSAPGVFVFFQRLYSSDFMPHGDCYFWRPEILWMGVVSDITITLAYYAIPLMLLYFVRKRRDLMFSWDVPMRSPAELEKINWSQPEGI